MRGLKRGAFLLRANPMSTQNPPPHSAARRALPHVFWALVAIGTFAIGYVAGDPPTGAHQTARPAAVRTGSGSETDQAASGSGERATPATVILTGEQARVRTFEILSEPNRIVRLRQVCELLDHMTPENWRDVREGFRVQTTSEGRTHDTEWHLMLERVGEVAGADAITEVLGPTHLGDMDQARGLLTGFADADAKAAHAWLETQPPEAQDQLRRSLIEGMARTDSKAALALSVALPHRVENLEGIVAGAMQHGGFREAEGLLASLTSRADVPDSVKYAVFHQLAQAQIHSADTAGDPARTLAWFEPYLGAAYIGQQSTGTLISTAAKAGAPAVMNWLDTHADRMTPPQTGAAFTAIAASWQAQAPEQFMAWMNANPDHPQYDAMAQTTASSFLRNGQIENAQQWAVTIRDPQMRATLDQAIAEANTRRNLQKPAQ